MIQIEHPTVDLIVNFIYLFLTVLAVLKRQLKGQDSSGTSEIIGCEVAMDGVAALCNCYSPTLMASTTYSSNRFPSSTFLGRSSLPNLEKSGSRQNFHEPVKTSISIVRALFWGPRKTVEARDADVSLGTFVLTGSSPEELVSEDVTKPQKISLSVVSSISKISSQDWDACAADATGSEKLNPFITHGFLSSLEESGSAVKETGWLPRHIIAQDEFENILGVVPLYLKSHSYGEFVFDHSWADAYHSYGSRYYPKLQCCVPFTPVTGQRILIRNTCYKDQVLDKLVWALKELTAKLQVSSLHITFPFEDEWKQMKEHGFLQRIGMQYHWRNRNYKNFEEFLMDMKQGKRKNIRQERKKE